MKIDFHTKAMIAHLYYDHPEKYDRNSWFILCALNLEGDITFEQFEDIVDEFYREK